MAVQLLAAAGVVAVLTLGTARLFGRGPALALATSLTLAIAAGFACSALALS